MSEEEGPNNIAWSLTAKEAVHHPGVQRLKEAVPCMGFMSKTSFKAMREGRAPRCKNNARWHFTPMEGVRWAIHLEPQDLCFKHLIYTGVCGSMDEEMRTRTWLETYRALNGDR